MNPKTLDGGRRRREDVLRQRLQAQGDVIFLPYCFIYYHLPTLRFWRFFRLPCERSRSRTDASWFDFFWILQGNFKDVEDKKHRAVYERLADSDQKLQYFSARQIGCRLLGCRGYLCQKVVWCPSPTSTMQALEQCCAQLS